MVFATCPDFFGHSTATLKPCIDMPVIVNEAKQKVI